MNAPANSASVEKKLILLIDDHPIFRHGIEAFLTKQQPEFTCLHADSPAAALQSIQDSPPDIAIVDVSLAGADGIPLIAQMKTKQPYLPVIVLSMHDEPASVLRAFKAGAHAYVMKTDPPRELMEAMMNTRGSGIFLSSRLRQNPAFKMLYDVKPMIDRLTDREAEVLVLIGRGHSTAAIADELGLSVKTVETHQAHIKDKLEFSSGNEMAEFAVNWVSYRATS